MNLSIDESGSASVMSRSPSPYFYHHQNQKCSVEVVIELDVLKNVLPQLSIAKMDPLSQVFCLRWNNHRSNLLNVFDLLLQTEAFCDVTLACDGASVKCHKIILSACSSYFQQLFMENNCEHPIVFLKDIKYSDIRSILAYMYKGEVNVQQEELPSLLKVAELLKVKGLVEEEREKLLNSGLKDPRSNVSTNDDHEPRPSTASSHKSKDMPSGKDSGPLTPTTGQSNLVPPFMCTPPGSRPQMPMWPIPGMFPGAHGLFGNGNADHNEKDNSPSPKEVGANKRKKTSSGSGGSTSSKEGNIHNNTNNNLGPGRDRERPEHDDRNDDKMNMDADIEKDNGMMSMTPGLEKSNIANYVPNQRLEWKRYKQYTRSDIMAAIDEVRKGMSALQASRKYGVPSRTLYDKVKKMGIVTGRQMQRKSLPQYPTSFPQFGGVMGMDGLKDLTDSRSKDMDENTNDSSSQPGDNLDGRATMVPTPGGGFPSMQMLSLMEKMKESERRGDSEISLMPMNLSTMLSSTGSRDLRMATSMASSPHHSQADREGASGNGHSRNAGVKREMSESSLSPGGEHDDVDIDDEEDVVESSSGSGSRRRDRHPSEVIRAQFMADLRRLGGNVPGQGESRAPRGHHPQDETASSTTHSPPPPASSSAVLSPVSTKGQVTSRSSEDSLPPRKRKVSQEQHANYNGGLHEDEISPEKQRSSTAPSPIPEQSELDCRN